ncbi:MAG: carboxypeptidase regulatory-like domain-containing protein [Bacteroidota bacterium]|nr:carboxypeptidase regulatory-like domain-containing protein [Bacteroidota bacterium]
MIKSILLSGSLLMISVNAVKANHTLYTSNSKLDLGALDKAKLERGKQKLFGQKYKEALAIFKEILTTNATDGPTLYYAAECHYRLGENNEALDYLKKGKESPNVKNETFFLLGSIYLKDGKIDEALAEFNAYKSKASEKNMNEVDAEVYISHCNNAKKLMESPVNVKIDNAGNLINSQFDDKAPSISADGKKLVFSSRRPETTDAPMDIEGDGKYFEDIYISSWDSAGAKWNAAEPVPGQVNVDGAHDACTGMSADGKQIFIYRNNINDPESRGGDIFVSKVNNNKWKTPESLGKPINSSYWEGGACVSPDGKTIFFTSERKGGLGHSDIWMVTRKTKTEWNKPVNMGAEINTSFDEGGMFLSPDGKTLFFCSNGPNSMGGQDIFRTILENGTWSKPVNLGYPINTFRDDKTFTISADAKVAYFASNREGGLGETDIYKVDLMDYAVLQKDFKKMTGNELSILKGMIRDGFEGKGLDGAEVELTTESGDKVTSTVTNEMGEYFFSVKGGTTYKIKISKKGFIDTNETINLPMGNNGETASLEKQFLLNKK